jgi:hypothetical protein
MHVKRWTALVLAMLILAVWAQPAAAAKVTVDLGDAKGVSTVGVFNRWDRDGNFRKPVDPKAKIDAPVLEHIATSAGGGKWEFKNLPAGTYDLVILAAQDRVRIEGFQYPPVLEFDPFFPGDATVEDEDDRDFIVDDISKAQHYENKVASLYLGQNKGEKKAIRILVMLIRDKVTSYEGDFPGAATMRHEVWQYDWNYGGWQKNKRTKVLDRVIMHRDELRKWTWLWDGKLGGIKVDKEPITIKYEMTENLKSKKLKGLYPY